MVLILPWRFGLSGFKDYALFLKDGLDFKRVVSFVDKDFKKVKLSKKIVVISSIAKANRLLEYIKTDTKTEVKTFFFKD